MTMDKQREAFEAYAVRNLGWAPAHVRDTVWQAWQAALSQRHMVASEGAGEVVKLDADLLETIREAAKTKAEGAITKDGRAVFINYGDSEQQMIDAYADLDCPACGGSGHVEDVPPAIQQIIADRLSPPVGLAASPAAPAALWVRTGTIKDAQGYDIGMDEPELKFGAARPEGDGWEPFYRATPLQQSASDHAAEARDALVKLREQLAAIPDRIMALSGQHFSYIKRAEVLDTIDAAMTPSPEQSE